MCEAVQQPHSKIALTAAYPIEFNNASLHSCHKKRPRDMGSSRMSKLNLVRQTV